MIITLILIFTGLLFAYLQHSNSVATLWYNIKQLQEVKNSLRTEEDIWNLKLVKVQSLSTLEKSISNKGMMTYKDQIFIDTGKAVAMSN